MSTKVSPRARRSRASRCWCGVTLGFLPELIAASFGEDVASLVLEVTDDKSLPKAVRKSEQIKTAATKSPRAKILKLADKTSTRQTTPIGTHRACEIFRHPRYVVIGTQEKLPGVVPALTVSITKYPRRVPRYGRRSVRLLPRAHPGWWPSVGAGVIIENGGWRRH
jgi:hypothetical protein